MMFEIVKGELQQTIEKMETELGVQPRTHDGNDQSSRVAKQRVIRKDDHHDCGQQHKRREAAKLQHLVDRRHDQKRREYR